MPLESYYQEMQDKIKKCEQKLATDLGKVRTGRAHPQLLDQVKVNSYGTEMPLAQLSSVHAEGARALVVTPWDKSQLAACEKAIRQADLGLNPSTQGGSIRVPLPELTAERRRDVIKIVTEIAETARIAIRNIRRAVIQDVKELLKDKQISEDEEKMASQKITKITQAGIERVDQALAQKEVDLSEL